MYMTWGRRFGGRQCDTPQINCSPNFVDFDHMQDSLESAYKRAADSISAFIAPVGISWKNVLSETKLITEKMATSRNRIQKPKYVLSYGFLDGVYDSSK